MEDYFINNNDLGIKSFFEQLKIIIEKEIESKLE